MTHIKETQDITGLLFPAEKLTSEEERIERKKRELWRLAEIDATNHLNRPIRFMNRTTAIYKKYLKQEGLVYDEERGF